MFDFGAIGNVVETLQNGIRDIDSRLESIETMTRLQTVIVIRTRLDYLASLQATGESHDTDDEEARELLVALANLTRMPVSIVNDRGERPSEQAMREADEL